MANAFSSMEYPHWLIVAGAVLLVLGFIGLAFRQRKGAEAKLNEGANGNEQGRSEFDAELAQTQAPIGRRSLRSRRGRDGLIKTAVPKRNRGTICRRFLTRNRNDRAEPPA